jgi:hypothetical protein
MSVDYNKLEDINVTTIQLKYGSIQDKIVNSSSNLNHLILHNAQLPSKQSYLTEILKHLTDL